MEGWLRGKQIVAETQPFFFGGGGGGGRKGTLDCDEIDEGKLFLGGVGVV